MGLDMYLNVSERISQYDYQQVGMDLVRVEDSRYSNVIEASGIKIKEDSLPSVSVEWNAIYWRKANQIHGWFVETCGDGVDECQRIPVSRDRLVELHSICGQLIDTRSTELAKELLPPTPGFFFGGYDIDEYYWRDIEETHQQLTELLDEITPENYWNYDIYYQSSW